MHLAQLCRRRPASGVRRGAESELQVQSVIQTSVSSCTPRRWRSASHRRLELSWLLLYAVLIRPPRRLRESRQRLMLLSLLCKLGSTLAVPKLWPLCNLRSPCRSRFGCCYCCVCHRGTIFAQPQTIISKTIIKKNKRIKNNNIKITRGVLRRAQPQTRHPRDGKLWMPGQEGRDLIDQVAVSTVVGSDVSPLSRQRACARNASYVQIISVITWVAMSRLE